MGSTKPAANTAPPVAPGEGADPVEVMLVEQMEAAHAAALDCLARTTAEEESPERCERALMHANRLMSLFARQVDVLGRHRLRRPLPRPDTGITGMLAALMAAPDDESDMPAFLAAAGLAPPGDHDAEEGEP